jgi:hypothetical protein
VAGYLSKFINGIYLANLPEMTDSGILDTYQLTDIATGFVPRPIGIGERITGREPQTLRDCADSG